MLIEREANYFIASANIINIQVNQNRIEHISQGTLCAYLNVYVWWNRL